MAFHRKIRAKRGGDIGRFTDGRIAISLDWDGNVPELIEALIQEKWLDQNKEYRLVIHDWSDHADDTCDKYLANHRMTYADGKEPRRKPEKRMKNRLPAEKFGEVGKSTEFSRLSESEPEPESEPHSQGAGEDEIYLILKERPELSMLTFEQDLMARKQFQSAPVTIDWKKVARMVTEKAVLAGTINQPGSWLRVQYDKVIRALYPEIFEKKAAGLGALDPYSRIFRTEKDKNGQTNIQ